MNPRARTDPPPRSFFIATPFSVPDGSIPHTPRIRAMNPENLKLTDPLKAFHSA